MPPHLVRVGQVGQWVAGAVVLIGATIMATPCALAQTASTLLNAGTPEYMLNVPPAHRTNPWQTMLLLARQRLQEIRCLIPQASLKGSFQEPKGELCYRKHGMRVCVSSKLSFDPNNYSGGFFITNRPGECPF